LKESLEYFREIDVNPIMIEKIQNLIDMLNTLEIIQNLFDLVKIKIYTDIK
jgi:hypothetical protein